MNPQLTPLTIDADQWRLDIKTFAEATNQALEAIVSKLSNRCSGDFSHQEIDLPCDPALGIVKTPTETTSAGSDTHGDNRRHDNCRGDHRLAELRSQLAQRLSKST